MIDLYEIAEQMGICNHSEFPISYEGLVDRYNRQYVITTYSARVGGACCLYELNTEFMKFYCIGWSGGSEATFVHGKKEMRAYIGHIHE